MAPAAGAGPAFSAPTAAAACASTPGGAEGGAAVGATAGTAVTTASPPSISIEIFICSCSFLRHDGVTSLERNVYVSEVCYSQPVRTLGCVCPLNPYRPAQFGCPWLGGGRHHIPDDVQGGIPTPSKPLLGRIRSQRPRELQTRRHM